MLPFLKKRQEVSVSIPTDIVKRDSDHEEEEDFDGLESCCEEMIDAFHSRDAKALAAALRAAFQICDLEPHEEGEHV